MSYQRQVIDLKSTDQLGVFAYPDVWYAFFGAEEWSRKLLDLTFQAVAKTARGLAESLNLITTRAREFTAGLRYMGFLLILSFAQSLSIHDFAFSSYTLRKLTLTFSIRLGCSSASNVQDTATSETTGLLRHLYSCLKSHDGRHECADASVCAIYPKSRSSHVSNEVSKKF